jgi:hypothetical protein
MRGPLERKTRCPHIDLVSSTPTCLEMGGDGVEASCGPQFESAKAVGRGVMASLSFKGNWMKASREALEREEKEIPKSDVAFI